jgi:hypothetical protein
MGGVRKWSLRLIEAMKPWKLQRKFRMRTDAEKDDEPSDPKV